MLPLLHIVLYASTINNRIFTNKQNNTLDFISFDAFFLPLRDVGCGWCAIAMEVVKTMIMMVAHFFTFKLFATRNSYTTTSEQRFWERRAHCNLSARLRLYVCAFVVRVLIFHLSALLYENAVIAYEQSSINAVEHPLWMRKGINAGKKINVADFVIRMLDFFRFARNRCSSWDIIYLFGKIKMTFNVI